MFNSSSTISRHSAVSERTLERAVRHVNEHWLPVNSGLLERVRAGMRDGRYDLDMRFLLQDVKADAGLFIWLIRALCSDPVVQAHGGAQLTVHEQLSKVPRETLERLLAQVEERSSRHVLAHGSEFQLRALQSAMISASAVEVLSERAGVDAEHGFTSALLRQLGMLLVAWNYPTVFRRVLDSVEEQLARGDQNCSLEQGLTKNLGFSPQTLASAVIAQWKGLDATTSAVVRGEEGEAASSQVAKKLMQLCEIGEALARASDPAHQPTARVDWERAQQGVHSVLGDHGMRLVAKQIRNNCASYIEQFPEAFSRSVDFAPDRDLRGTAVERVRQSNQYLVHCSNQLQRSLVQWYASMPSGKDRRSHLNTLLHNVVPLAGAIGGAVYTLEPADGTLLARVGIGSVALRDLSPVRVNSALVNSADLILTAWHCATPVVENRGGEHGDGVIAIAAALGDTEKVGVLYLEFAALLDDGNAVPLHHFRALRQALQDCLLL